MNGAQRQLALIMAAGFSTILLVIMVANAESSVADLHAGGANIPRHLVWSWEWSSMIAWVGACPFIWFAVTRMRPPRFAWWQVAVAGMVGSLLASAWHVGVMVALRHVYYDATGNGPYLFFGVIDERLLYEYRKDLGTYLQFVGLAAIAQWLIARLADPPAAAPPAEGRIMAVPEGAVTHLVPVAEIDWVQAAGNYVELGWGQRHLLHRATLAAVGEELGDGFVRIHRSRLVRRAAIRTLETDKSGDFIVRLQDGSELRGSRRYRSDAQASI